MSLFWFSILAIISGTILMIIGITMDVNPDNFDIMLLYMVCGLFISLGGAVVWGIHLYARGQDHD